MWNWFGGVTEVPYHSHTSKTDTTPTTERERNTHKPPMANWPSIGRCGIGLAGSTEVSYHSEKVAIDVFQFTSVVY